MMLQGCSGLRDPGSSPLSVFRQERFALGVVSQMTKREAYRAAGYRGNLETQPYMLCRKPHVMERIAWLQKKAEAEGTRIFKVSREQITGELEEIYTRAMEGTPILAKDGTPTGVCRPDLPSAIRAVEVKAKAHGLLVADQPNENLDDELEDKSPEQLKAFVLGLLETLDPNMRKALVADLEKRASDDAVEVEGTVLQ